jgi:hypothetical protein
MKFCFCELPVGTFFLFRGQRFKKLETSLAEDSKSARIIFDRGTEVELIGKEETPIIIGPQPTHQPRV